MPLLLTALPLAVFSLLPACAPDETKPEDSADAASGPVMERIDVPVGYRVMDIPVEAGWLDGRAVPMNLWYATDATGGDHPIYIELFQDEQSIVDAPFKDPAPGELLPLVIYSHGSQGWAGNASPLLRHLVAQGWIAAGPDHVGNTLLDNEDPRPISYPLTRMADVIATIDAIKALPEGDPLHGRVDTDHVLVMGHSFGGQTAWLLSGPAIDAAALEARCVEAPGCTEAEIAAFSAPPADPRIRAVMPLDGFAWEDVVAASGWAQADRPILYMARSGDGDDAPFLTAAAAGPTWVRFEGACHETFTSTPLPCDFEKEDGLDLVAAYLTAFGAAEILGLREPPWTEILDGTTSLDPRVTVHLP